jgi:Flp pilus assembly protein TadG
MKRLSRRAASDRGAVAVEFALILPVLLLIVVGTIEFGRVYSQVQVYNGSAREGARCAAVMAQSFATCRSLGDVQRTINDASDPYADPPAAVITTGGVAGTGCTDLTIGRTVTVSWNQPLRLDIPFWGNVTVTPTIKASFRCE